MCMAGSQSDTALAKCNEHPPRTGVVLAIRFSQGRFYEGLRG